MDIVLNASEAPEMKRLIARLKQDETGATAVEYAIIVALIVVACIGAITGVATETTNKWNYVSGEVRRNA